MHGEKESYSNLFFTYTDICIDMYIYDCMAIFAMHMCTLVFVNHHIYIMREQRLIKSPST